MCRESISARNTTLSMAGNQSEKSIERAILEWLAWNKVFAWKVENQGTYDPKMGRYRTFTRMKGISDIIGIAFGKPLAIEVKSTRGKLTAHQKVFLDRFNKEGGVGFVARSVDDVAARLRLEKYRVECEQNGKVAS